MSSQTYPERIKAYRRSTGLTQVEFGKCFGVSGSQVHSLEHGMTPAPRAFKRFIDRCTDKSLTTLFIGWRNEVYPTPVFTPKTITRRAQVSA